MDPLTLLTIISSLASIAQGVSAQQAAKTESEAEKAQAAVALAEGKEKAEQTKVEGEQFKASQALAYLASGVNLEGAPLGTLMETQNKIEQETDAILKRAQSQYSLDINKANALENKGTAALLGSVASGATTASKLLF